MVCEINKNEIKTQSKFIYIFIVKLFHLQFWQKINGQTSKFARKLHFLGIRKVLNLGLKSKKPFQNENHTEDWALGSLPWINTGCFPPSSPTARYAEHFEK